MSSIPVLRIGSIGLSLREELLLMAMLRISAADHPRLRWEYVSDQACDVVVGAEQHSGAGIHEVRPLPVAVIRHGDMQRDGLALHFPLRITAVCALLDQLERRMLKPVSLASEAPRSAASAVVSARTAVIAREAATALRVAPASEGFTERLHRQLQERPDILELGAAGQPPVVVIECWRKQYFLPAERPAAVGNDSWVALLNQLTETCEIRTAPNTRVAHLACAAPRRALDRLLWRLGIMTPDLLKWLPAHARFQLRRWPDFGALGTQAKFIKLAALLVRQASSLETLVRDGHMPRSDVVAFLNGSELCGLLKVVAPTAEVRSLPRPAPRPAVPVEAGMRGLLGRIRSALHLG